MSILNSLLGSLKGGSADAIVDAVKGKAAAELGKKVMEELTDGKGDADSLTEKIAGYYKTFIGATGASGLVKLLPSNLGKITVGGKKIDLAKILSSAGVDGGAVFKTIKKALEGVSGGNIADLVKKIEALINK